MDQPIIAQDTTIAAKPITPLQALKKKLKALKKEIVELESEIVKEEVSCRNRFNNLSQSANGNVTEEQFAKHIICDEEAYNLLVRYIMKALNERKRTNSETI